MVMCRDQQTPSLRIKTEEMKEKRMTKVEVIGIDVSPQRNNTQNVEEKVGESLEKLLH